MTPARARRASLASRAPGNTVATSGASGTTILPLAYRDAYLFGRERLKSYSGKTSSMSTGRIRAFLAFPVFIFPALPARCFPRADHMDRLAPLGEHYHEQATSVRLVEQHEALLAL